MQSLSLRRARIAVSSQYLQYGMCMCLVRLHTLQLSAPQNIFGP